MDAHVGRPADAFLLQHLHEGRLGVARGRGGGVRRGLVAAHRHRLSLGERGEQRAVLVLVVLSLVDRFLVRGAVTLERDGCSARGELALRALRVSGCRAQPDSHGCAGGIGHLRGERALVDQCVETEFVTAQLACHLLGRADRQCGADRLVCLLGVLRLVREGALRRRDVVVAVLLHDVGPDLGDRLVAEHHAVGPHVGDVAALVQRLGGAHDCPAGEAQLATCLLLQQRRGER